MVSFKPKDDTPVPTSVEINVASDNIVIEFPDRNATKVDTSSDDELNERIVRAMELNPRFIKV